MSLPTISELVKAKCDVDRNMPYAHVSPRDYLVPLLRKRLEYAQELELRAVVPRQQLLAMLYFIAVSTAHHFMVEEPGRKMAMLLRLYKGLEPCIIKDSNAVSEIRNMTQFWALEQVRQYDVFMKDRPSCVGVFNDEMEKLAIMLIMLKRAELKARYEAYLPESHKRHQAYAEVAKVWMSHAINRFWYDVYQNVIKEQGGVIGDDIMAVDPPATPVSWALWKTIQAVGLDFQYFMQTTLPFILEQGLAVAQIDGMLQGGRWGRVAQTLLQDSLDLENLICPLAPFSKLHEIKIVVRELREVYFSTKETDFEAHRWESWIRSQLAQKARKDESLRSYVLEYVKTRVNEKVPKMRRKHDIVQRMFAGGRINDK